jgi:hypothetical protein
VPDQPEIIVTITGNGEHSDGRYRAIEIENDMSGWPDFPALKIWLDPESSQPDGSYRLPEPPASVRDA